MRGTSLAVCSLSGSALALVMLASCGGSDLIQEGVTSDGRELSFPTQSFVVGAREPGRGLDLGFYVEFSTSMVSGYLIEEDGCLRLGGDTSETYVVIWPAGYQLAIDGNMLEIRDKEGTPRLIVGDGIAVSGIDTGSVIKLARFLSGPEAIKLMKVCDGPYWLAGDQIELIQAIEVLTPTDESVELMLVFRARDGREIIFPKQAMPHIYRSGQAPAPGGVFNAQLIEDGGCIRGGSEAHSYLIIWPPGFQLMAEYEWIVISNETGLSWAVIGDSVVLGGHEVDTVEELARSIPNPYASMVAGRCPGPYWILSDPVQVGGPNDN